MFHALEKAFNKAFDKDHFAWCFPLCVAGSGALTLFPLTVSSSDLSVIFYALTTVPLVCLFFLIPSFKYRGKQRVAAVSAFSAFLIFTAILNTHFVDIRDAVRWSVHGRAFRAEVLAQSDLTGASLRHVEWEGWGFAGSDTTVYLVFDPTDTLAAAAKKRSSGKFGDVPCEVFRIRQREKEWYTVQFYTNTDWEYCGN
jgi:hypothetical protein